jgi:hypothetical protein
MHRIVRLASATALLCVLAPGTAAASDAAPSAAHRRPAIGRQRHPSRRPRHAVRLLPPRHRHLLDVRVDDAWGVHQRRRGHGAERGRALASRRQHGRARRHAGPAHAAGRRTAAAADAGRRRAAHGGLCRARRRGRRGAARHGGAARHADAAGHAGAGRHDGDVRRAPRHAHRAGHALRRRASLPADGRRFDVRRLLRAGSRPGRRRIRQRHRAFASRAGDGRRRTPRLPGSAAVGRHDARADRRAGAEPRAPRRGVGLPQGITTRPSPAARWSGTRRCCASCHP